MNRSSIRSLVVVTLALSLAPACSRQKEEIQPSKLLSPLKSYDSISDVEGKLHVPAAQWQTLEDRKPLPSDQRPEFRTYIAVFTFFHHGVEGTLVVHFYNGRLMRTQFFPKDLQAYKSALTREDSISFNDQQESFIAPATRVWIGKDDRGATYVGWVDKNLKSEMDNWIKKYS